MKKKGVSVIIGYVLLVAFAITTSIFVYSWLKTYTPADILECQEGVSLMIEDYELANGILTLTIKNNGRFDVAGYFIRAAVNPEKDLATIDLSSRITSGGQRVYNSIRFSSTNENLFQVGEVKTSTFDLSDLGEIALLEIVPIRFQEEEGRIKLASCSNKKTKEFISVSGGGGESCTPDCGLNECGLDPVCGGLDCGDCLVLYGEGYTCESGSCVFDIYNMDGLVSWWRFLGNANDEIGGNDGTIYGADCNVAGKYGLGCEFDGVGDYIDLGDISYSGWTEATFSAWINVNDLISTHHSIICNHGSTAPGGGFWTSTYYSNSALYFEVRKADDSGYYGGSILFSDYLDEWAFVTFTINNSFKKIYINGTEVLSSVTGEGVLLDSVYNTYVGRIGSSSSFFFNGTLDEVMIFNKSLTEDEINILYELDLG